MKRISHHPLIATAVVLLAVSCSFFDPREPSDPDPGDDIPWQTPSTPSIVMVNLENALEGRSISLSMACFDPGYEFLADPSDISEFGGSWDFLDWDYDVEQNTLTNIFAAVVGSGYPEDSLVSVTMSVPSQYPDPAVPQDTVEIWRDYEIALAGSGEYGGWDHPAKGRTRVIMIEDEDYGLWSIISWQDIRPEGYTGENLTWGVVKATYR